VNAEKCIEAGGDGTGGFRIGGGSFDAALEFVVQGVTRSEFLLRDWGVCKARGFVFG